MSLDTMVKKQEELENLKKYLKNLGLNEDSICNIASGNFKNENPEITNRCMVTLEIRTNKDIVKKYPNFIFNYKNEKDFLISQVANLNQFITLDECEVYRNLHSQFEDPDFEIEDFGYKQIVKKVEFL